MSRLALLVALALPACDAVPADSGAQALLRVEAGHFHPGAPPAEGGGPRVTAIVNPQFALWRGQVGKPLGGALARGATSALLALDGDGGYWVVEASVPDITAPDDPTFHATLDLSPRIPLGPRVLVVRGADIEGHVGPAHDEPLVLFNLPPPTGALVITLAWDTEADLDLHVVTPAGVEIWAHHAFESSAPPGQPPGPTVGHLDFDSNAGCVIDGRRQESVLWQEAPPAGHYRVRVDTASLCAARLANWTLSASLQGATVGTAIGQSDASDERSSAAAGSGLLALELDVP